MPEDHDQRPERTVLLGDPALREIKGFTQVPNFLLKHPKLSFGAKVAFGVLLSYAWQDNFCHPAQDRLATDLACSVRQVQRLLTELKAYGLLTWRQRGLNRPNIYTLLPKGISRTRLNDINHTDTTSTSSPDMTNPSRPATTHRSRQDATSTSHKEYSENNTQYVDVANTSKTGELQPIEPTSRLSGVAFQEPTIAPAKISYLAEEMARACGDHKQVSLATFRRIASTLGEQTSFELIAITNEAARDGIIRDNRRGAYLVGVAKKMAQARGIELGLRSDERREDDPAA